MDPAAQPALIRDAVYAAPNGALNSFLPVVLPGESVAGIPAFLGPNTTTHYPVVPLDETGVEPLLRVLSGQPAEVEPILGTIPDLPPRSHDPAPVPLALSHRITLDVTSSAGRVSCRTELGGTLLGEREARMPAGVATPWDALKRPPEAASRQLAEVGHRLREALFDEQTIANIAELLDRSPLGTVVDIELRGDEAGFALPFELLRMSDGRPLCTLPGARFHRRVPGVDRAVAKALPGPLKILVAVGAPEETLTESDPFDVEAAMQAILDAIGGVESAGRAQVRILEVGGPGEIEAALREDQYHVLHISAHGSAAGLELENEDGEPMPVAAADLVAHLRAAGRPLPLVVLSSCAGAARGAGSLAAQLVEHGVDRVLAMQAAVTDDYATLLARQFYDALGTTRDATAGAALATARRSVEAARAKADTASTPPEFGVATLLTAGDDTPLVDAGATADPIEHATQAPGGGAVRSLRIGELIGRRKQLREALSALRGGPAAAERFGDVSGVVLTGVGGIGKTALAGRIERRLAEAGWLTAVHEGSWDPSKLTAAVVAALGAHPQLSEARELLAGPDLDEAAKLDLTCQLLARVPLLVLFDDFERNLDAEDGSFSDAGFEEIFGRLCDAARAGKLLVTSRYPIATADPWLRRIPMPALSPAELRRLLIRLPALRALDLEERVVVMRTIGGHPRLIEFVDAMLRGGTGNLREVTRKLRTLARDEGVELSEPAGLEQTLSDAVLLGSRDIVLGELFSHLDAEERELALQAAVSRVPMSIADLALARHGDDATPQQQAAVRRAADRLVDLTLLSPADRRHRRSPVDRRRARRASRCRTRQAPPRSAGDAPRARTRPVRSSSASSGDLSPSGGNPAVRRACRDRDCALRCDRGPPRRAVGRVVPRRRAADGPRGHRRIPCARRSRARGARADRQSRGGRPPRDGGARARRASGGPGPRQRDRPARRSASATTSSATSRCKPATATPPPRTTKPRSRSASASPTRDPANDDRPTRPQRQPRQARRPRAAQPATAPPPPRTTKPRSRSAERLADRDPANDDRPTRPQHQPQQARRPRAASRRQRHRRHALPRRAHDRPAPRRPGPHQRDRPTRPQHQPQQARRPRAASRRQRHRHHALPRRAHDPPAPRRPGPHQRRPPNATSASATTSSATSRCKPATATPPPRTTTPRSPSPSASPTKTPPTRPPNATSASATTSSATSRCKPATATPPPRTTTPRSRSRQRLADQDPANADRPTRPQRQPQQARRPRAASRRQRHRRHALPRRPRDRASASPTRTPPTPTAQRDLSVSHNKLGDLALQAGDSDTAATHYHAALAVLETRFGADDPWAVEIRAKLDELPRTRAIAGGYGRSDSRARAASPPRRTL